MKKISLFLTGILFCSMTFAQVVTLEGYAYETGNRGFLNQVSITLFDASSNAIKGNSLTDSEGYFSFDVAPNMDYMVRGEKKGFKTSEVEFTTKGKKVGDKVFVKMEIERQPGYIFDVTLAERRPAPGVPVDAISGSLIEVYNNTLKKEELVLKDHPSPSFNATFEQGNHYTVMVRKDGFFTKRMEAYVNVEGCILCFDGVGDVRPGVSDVMTKDNTMGTLLANVELDRIELNKTIKIENIYYDLAKWEIRDDAAEELDKLLVTLKDNPALIVELGSHTDSRGQDSYNLELSEQRAKAAVDYLIENGIDEARIGAKGYGETRLVNECKNGVRCSERRHQLNRRTELKITGFLDDDPYKKLSLKQILEEEEFQRMLQEVQNGGELKVKEGEAPPKEIIKQVRKKQAEKNNAPTKIDNSNSIPTKTDNSNNDLSTTGSSLNIPVSKPTKEVRTNTSITSITSANAANEISRGNDSSSGKIFSGKDIEAMAKQETAKPTTINTNSKMVSEEKVTVNNKPAIADLPANYSGYRVQLLVSNSKLPSSHQIFSQHGNLTLEQTKDGTYAYLLGEFNELEDVEGFYKHIVKPRYLDSKIIQYQNGKRIVK